MKDKNKKKKGNLIMKIIFSSSILTTVLFMVIIIACLLVLDFFGANITDGYVEGNMEYAEKYRSVLNKYLKNGYGYVSLERILYFYLVDDSLTFDEIYKDNLDNDSKKMLPISSVCELEKYKYYSVCKDMSGQINEDQNKPFSPPIDFSKISITSYFMEERILFGNYDYHGGWDLAASNQTPVLATCDGEIKKVSFPFKQNVTDTSGGGGNQIILSCIVDDLDYRVTYAHLYPGSAKVKTGDKVKTGQQLAGVGTTGYSTGPHLHYQVNLNGTKVDGMSLVDFTNVKPGFQPLTPGGPGTFPANPYNNGQLIRP